MFTFILKKKKRLSPRVITVSKIEPSAEVGVIEVLGEFFFFKCTLNLGCLLPKRLYSLVIS
jgi:hypothetical protein